MRKEISTSEVKAFLGVAPPSILAELKSIIDKRLDAIVDEDNRRNAVRQTLQGGQSTGDQDPDLSNIVSARAEMAALMAGTPSETGSSDLRAQFERQQKIDTFVPSEVKDAKLTFMFADNYGDGHCAINDPQLKEMLEVSLAKCKRDNVYFPYGFGKNNDLLKIKKFISAEKGQALTMGLKFSKWNQAGKVGFSCYAK
jgi:hypothetical protein